MKHLLDLSVRTFCSLWESAVEVSPATPWSWDQTKQALMGSPRMGPGLVEEWEALSEEDRTTGLRILAEYEPITPSGDVVRFKSVDGVRMFGERVIAQGITVLNDTTVDVVGGPRGHSLRSLAKDCGGYLVDSILQANYAHVDVTAPRDILETGFDCAEAADLFSKVIRGEMAESDLRHERAGDIRQFAGRMARFAKARHHLGGRDVLALAAQRGGVLSELGEGTISVKFPPKVYTAEDIDLGTILEARGTAAFMKAMKLRITEANTTAEMDAEQAALKFSEHLERDHLSMLTTLGESVVTVPVCDRTIAGVPDWLVEHAKSIGLMDVDTAAKLLLFEQRKANGTSKLLTEAGASVGPGGSAASASGDDGERGGVSHEQPDVKGGRTAQSQAEPTQEPQAPTEHVPDSEEGAPGGDVKLADGTIVPEPVMKDAMAKLLQNLATQLQQDTETDGQPKPPEGDEDGEEEEDPEAAQKDAEAQAKADQAAAASQATQTGAPQPVQGAAQTAVSGPKGTGMAEADYTSLAQRLLNGEITVAEAIAEKKADDDEEADKRESSRASMGESGWMDDLQKIVPHVEAGLKAAGYKKDDNGYWCEKDGDDKIKISPTPNGLLLVHSDSNSVMMEQLDVGAGAEGEQAAQAVADAADAMKALRGAVFALSTDHLVRIASMAAALGAKPAASEAESLRKEVEKLMDVTAELAKKLDKVNDRLKAKAGVDAGEIQAQAVEPVVEEPPPEEVPPVEPLPVEEPAPAPAPEQPMTEYQQENEKKIREALARCADTDIPSSVWEGAPYSQIRRAIMAECRDLGLSSDQIAEVRNRMRRLEGANVGRVYEIELTEGDRGLLMAVSVAKNDAPAQVIQAASEARGVPERTLAEAVDRLRQYGELEHRLLAGALDKQMVAALAAVE